MANFDGKVALSLCEMLNNGKTSSGQPAAAMPRSEETLTAPRKSNNFQPYHAQSVPKSQDLEATAFVRQSSGESMEVTTVMLRNIPNKYTQNSLLQEINDLGFAGSFDFFYLPMDVHNRSNVGYAFINFLVPNDAERFRVKFSDHCFQRFQSRKISSVCTAHVQGLYENLRHFENRAVSHSRNDQYRPVVLRDGARVDCEEVLAKLKISHSSSSSTSAGSSADFSSSDSESRHASKDSLESAVGTTVLTFGKAARKRGGQKTNIGAQKQQPATTKRAPAAAAAGQHRCLPQAPLGAATNAALGTMKTAPRDGLECAIRELLGSTAAPPGLALPPGLVQQQGLDVAEEAAAAAAAAAHLNCNGQAAEAAQGGSDITQLLSLRSLLLDRLVQKDAVDGLHAYQQAASFLAMQQQQQQQEQHLLALHQQEQHMRLQATSELNPQSPVFTPSYANAPKWEDPAYVRPSSDLAGLDCRYDYENIGLPTPRTNNLLLESSIRGYGPRAAVWDIL